MPEQVDAVVIGGGQAGLATGYFLARRRVLLPPQAMLLVVIALLVPVIKMSQAL